MSARKYTRSQALAAEAHRLIPGGCHTYAKGDDQYPEEAPGFIVRGQGCHVRDLDGNEFIEYGMGLRAVSLGHAYPPVVEAAATQLRLGSNFTRPAAIEVDCAKTLLDMVPGHDCVKFAKDGSATTSAAVKLSRAFTGRDLIAICRDQPFFASEDWFIGTTEVNAGIPDAIRRLTVGFPLQRRRRSGAAVRDPPRESPASSWKPPADEPAPGTSERVRELCDLNGTVLIFDEMITGSLGQRRRGGGLRRPAGPRDLRQGDGQRLRTVRAGGPT